MTVAGETEEVKSYSGLYAAQSEVFYPKTIERIQQLFSHATITGRKVSFRENGFSFDSQALNNDMLISLRYFNTISIDVEAKLATVGAGAIWADVLRESLKHGQIPPVMVSTGQASAAGTLSANCLSRFSPVVGKEGKSVASFQIITADSVVRTCSRMENPELFYAAIGGFGYFGAVVSITYRLIYVGTPVRVKSIVTRKNHIDDLHKDLMPEEGHSNYQTKYSVFGIAGNKIRTMVVEAEYSNDEKLSQMLPHQPEILSRLMTEFLIQWIPPMGKFFWNYAYDVYTRFKSRFVDTIEGYTFFMDGNVRAKVLGRKIGMKFRAIQQTFIVPPTQKALSHFMTTAVKLMEKEGVSSAMFDALYLPADEGFLFSSTRSMDGFAVSMAFESLNDARIVKIKKCLEQLSELCLEMGGRVHLTKNVMARPEHIRQMYGEVIEPFFAIKRKYDPHEILRNDFIEKLFGEIQPHPALSKGEG